MTEKQLNSTTNVIHYDQNQHQSNKKVTTLLTHGSTSRVALLQHRRESGNKKDAHKQATERLKQSLTVSPRDFTKISS